MKVKQCFLNLPVGNIFVWKVKNCRGYKSWWVDGSSFFVIVRDIFVWFRCKNKYFRCIFSFEWIVVLLFCGCFDQLDQIWAKPVFNWHFLSPKNWNNNQLFSDEMARLFWMDWMCRSCKYFREAKMDCSWFSLCFEPV